jgi:hypothetical protein
MLERFTDICQPYNDGKILVPYGRSINLRDSQFEIDQQLNKMNFDIKVCTSTE